MEQLTPQVDKLRHDLAGVQSYLARDLKKALQQSTSFVNEGLENAASLQQILAVLMKTVVEGNSQVAFAQQQSLEHVSSRTNKEMAVFMTAMAAAVASSASLQNEIVSNLESPRPGRMRADSIRNFRASRPQSWPIDKRFWKR